jgi:lambda repressor-like predicted transcriptional regulator
VAELKEMEMVASTAPSLLEKAALTAAMPIVLALDECSPELREEAINLFKDLQSGDLDDAQRNASLSLLAEILYPNADADGLPGLDLEEVERMAPSQNPEARSVLDSMDKQEATFAAKLQELMASRNLTQAELAAKVGIGQPAISMMLNRSCRPQEKTVRRFAEALSVEPGELWPGLAK